MSPRNTQKEKYTRRPGGHVPAAATTHRRTKPGGQVMTSTETANAAANGARNAVELSTELWQQGATSLTERAERLWQLPQSDAVSDATRKYFEYLQDGLEVNKNVALKWIGALTSITEAVRDQLSTVTDFQ